MVTLGIVFGFMAAFVQSCAYVFSRAFMVRHANSVVLVIYSVLVAGMLAALALPVCLIFVHFDFSWKFWLYLAGGVLYLMIGHFAFFKTCHEMEPSRLSSLLGLKIIVLALLALAVLDEKLNFMQVVAVVLCSVSAVGMNLTGGRITLKGAAWLAVTLLSYAIDDLLVQKLTYCAHSDVAWLPGVATAVMFYAVNGIVVLPGLLFVERRWVYLRDASWFGTSWLVAIGFLLVSFNLMSLVYAGIIQSSRGIISVLIGALLLKLGYSELEPAVDRRAWIRRLLMAVVMVAAMALYSYGRTLN